MVVVLSTQGTKAAGVSRVLSFDELLEVGASNPRDAIPPTAKDISTIMYTSGTTGMSCFWACMLA